MGGDERGAAAVLVLLGIVVFVGMLALSIDLGIILTARTEAQRTSDGAALAGAASLITAPKNEDRAREWAKQWANENPVRKSQITLRDQDIDVVLDSNKVRVRVLRRQDYGGPIPTIFARIFDIDFVNVDAVAAAEAAVQGAGTSCTLPVVIPWPWINPPEPEEGSDLEFDGVPPDQLEPPDPPGDANDPSPNGTALWWGRRIVLSPSQGGQGGNPPSTRLQPGFWDLWLPEAFSGVPPINERIEGCVLEDPVVQPCEGEGEQCMWREAGNKQAVAKTFEDVISANLDHFWKWEDAGCPDYSLTGTGWDCDFALGGHAVYANDDLVTWSDRWRPVPVMNPITYQQGGSGPHIEVIALTCVWLDDFDVGSGPPGQRNIYAILVPCPPGEGGDGEIPGPSVKYLRLVE
jgi:hypothetical protein